MESVLMSDFTKTKLFYARHVTKTMISQRRSLAESTLLLSYNWPWKQSKERTRLFAYMRLVELTFSLPSLFLFCVFRNKARVKTVERPSLFNFLNLLTSRLIQLFIAVKCLLLGIINRECVARSAKF